VQKLLVTEDLIFKRVENVLEAELQDALAMNSQELRGRESYNHHRTSRGVVKGHWYSPEDPKAEEMRRAEVDCRASLTLAQRHHGLKDAFNRNDLKAFFKIASQAMRILPSAQILSTLQEQDPINSEEQILVSEAAELHKRVANHYRQNIWRETES
jgi:hypothetical protein